jgi:hypothetical protein
MMSMMSGFVFKPIVFFIFRFFIFSILLFIFKCKQACSISPTRMLPLPPSVCVVLCTAFWHGLIPLPLLFLLILRLIFYSSKLSSKWGFTGTVITLPEMEHDLFPTEICKLLFFLINHNILQRIKPSVRATQIHLQGVHCVHKSLWYGSDHHKHKESNKLIWYINISTNAILTCG